MKFYLSKSIVSVIAASLVFATFASSVTRADDKNEIVRRAGSTYYNLKAAGMRGFHCNVSLNWERSAGTFPADDPFSTEKGRQAMSAIKFPLSFDMDGGFGISSPTIQYTGDDMLDRRLSNSPEYVNQMVGNFFQAWRSFADGTFLPSAQSDYRIEETATNYRLLYKENGSDVELDLAKDFQVTLLTINSKDFKIAIRPTFIKTTKGYLISGIDSDLTDPNGARLNIVMGIKYQNIDGFAVPSKVSYDISSGKQSTSLDVSFLDYQITKS